MGDGTLWVFWWLGFRALVDKEDGSYQKFIAVEDKGYEDDDDESKDHHKLWIFQIRLLQL